MSPTKKKAPAPKKTTAKKAASKSAPAAKPARPSKTEKPASARKSAAATKPAATPRKAKAPAKAGDKKSEKVQEKAAPKAAEPKTTTAKSSAKAAPVPSTESKATGKSKGKAAAGKKADGDGTTAQAPAKRSKPRKPVTPTGPRHPKLGFRWSCYGCGAKFYDLGKEEPLCPKCGADQRDRPADEPRQNIPDPARPRVVRPMAQLLDDDEPVAPLAEDELGIDDVVEAGDMFESDGDITHLELDPAELAEESIEASEPDEY